MGHSGDDDLHTLAIYCRSFCKNNDRQKITQIGWISRIFKFFIFSLNCHFRGKTQKSHSRSVWPFQKISEIHIEGQFLKIRVYHCYHFSSKVTNFKKARGTEEFSLAMFCCDHWNSFSSHNLWLINYESYNWTRFIPCRTLLTVVLIPVRCVLWFK